MAIRKAILGCFLVFLGVIPCSAASIGINQFSGLDTQDNPSALQPSQSPDLLNVRLQPGGRSVFKRDGYGLFQTLPSGQAIHGGYHFQQTGGADVQLWGSSTTLYSSVNDATFVAIATGTLNATWQCTDNLGFAYCLTSANDTPVKTDGSLANTTYQPSIPAGTMIASTPLQLLVAGVSGSASSIYVSANNNFTNFTTGPLPTDPYVEIVNSPGSRLTHLGYYFGNVYFWKDQSMGYMSGSASQGTVGFTIVSNQIGTLDNSSAFWNPTTYNQGSKFSSGANPVSSGNPYFNEMSSLGGVFFRGQDNHVYQYDGYSLTRLSRIITPNITSSSRRKANSWTQSTTIDFKAGAIVNTDTTTIQNQIILVSTSDIFSSLSNWATTSSTCPWTSSGGFAFTSSGSAAGIGCTLAMNNSIQTIKSQKFILHYQFRYFPYVSGGSVVNVKFFNSSGNGYCISTVGGNAGSIRAGTFAHGSGDICNANLSVGISTITDSSIHYADLVYSATGYAQLYLDGISQGTFQDASNLNMNKMAIGGTCASPNQATCSGDAFQINNAYVSASTGTYYSAVNNAPNLTSWGTMGITDFTNGASSITYYSRSSTNSFTVLSATPSWVFQSKNATVAASTGTYIQLRSDFYITAATETPNLNLFTFNWFEGSALDKAYINYFQDAIWFSVSSGSTTSTNNTIFYLDLLNNTWLKDDITANGFLIENNALYFGSPLVSNIYKFGGVITDNSGPIHSYWKSMDFMGQDPTVQNSFEQSDFAFAESSNTITFTYDVDQSTSLLKSLSIPLYSTRSSILKRGFSLANGEIGTYFNFKVEDNSSLAPWTLMGQRTTYTPLPWRPQLAN